MTDLDLTFTAPTRPLSVNEGGHWAARRRRTEPWKDAAWATAWNARIRQTQARAARGWRRSPIAPAPVPITVQVVLPFRTKARRDAHNYTGTVVKAVVDGIVLAGLVPDDTPDWVTVLDSEFSIQPDKSEHLTATVRIRPRSDHAPD